MPLLKHGFLGTEGEQIQQQILKKYSELFGHLRDFNDICHEYLSGLRIDREAETEVFTIAYFIRGLKTFQSLILLLERGMLDDVRVLGRTLLHTHFRLAALANDPTVLKRIRTSALAEQKKRLESYKSGKRKVPANANKVDLDQLIAQAQSQLQKMGGSGINEKELAKIGGRLRDYDEAYAILSDAVHTSLSDVLPSMKFGHKSNFLGYIYGPDDRDLAMYAGYLLTLQSENLVNSNEVIKRQLPASFEDFKKRSMRITSDMPGVFNRKSVATHRKLQ
jgi:Family of unknown function (DUF5677)